MPRFGGPGKKRKRCINRACKGVQQDVQPKDTPLSDVSNTQSKPVNQTVSRYTTEEVMKV